MEEDDASINSELRFIVLELMKLAAQKGSSFDEELDDFIGNTYKLRQALDGYPRSHGQHSKRAYPASKARR